MEPSVIDNKGFTGQEELDKLALVHLNGRIYDPFTARFISADPEIQDPEHSQSYNRYTYVWNNPTNLTDPTGFLTTQQVTQALKNGTAKTTLADGTIVGLQGVFDSSGNLISLTVSVPGDSTNKTLSILGFAAGSTVTVSVAQSKSGAAISGGNYIGGLAPSASLSDKTVGKIFDKIGDAWNFVNDEFIQRLPFEAGAEHMVAGAFGVIKTAVVGEKVVQEVRVAEDAAQLAKPAQTAAQRAEELHSVLDPRAQRARTTAVTETEEGVRVVSSSERRLSPAQRAQLRADEVEGVGAGHAETTGVNAARKMGLNPTGTAASRPICSNCAGTLQNESVAPLSPLKQ